MPSRPRTSTGRASRSHHISCTPIQAASPDEDGTSWNHPVCSGVCSKQARTEGGDTSSRHTAIVESRIGGLLQEVERDRNHDVDRTIVRFV